MWLDSIADGTVFQLEIETIFKKKKKKIRQIKNFLDECDIISDAFTN